MARTRSFKAAIATLVLAGATALPVVPALAQQCVPIRGLETGPHDYRTPPADVLFRVEKFHYNRDVELLRKGLSTVNIGEDLEFVLRYFPNHHRALNSMVKLGLREHTDTPRGNKDTVDCWFQRAIAFVPDDGVVNLIYAIWLDKRQGASEAATQLELARRNGPPNNANFQYNLGIVYLDIGDYEHALEAAHRAYALGYPLKGLQDRLQRAGKWRPVAPGVDVQQSTGLPASKP
ncbi:MAG: hypothetical protein IT518_27410 [Burkholderiales bacterium]|nr:hypothetical protein [Burkholderiales bacterium]